MQFDLSVIIPLFNAEAYVEKTAENIIRLNDSNELTYEIILVNDGSVDSTEEKCTLLKNKYSNIVTSILSSDQYFTARLYQKIRDNSEVYEIA